MENHEGWKNAFCQKKKACVWIINTVFAPIIALLLIKVFIPVNYFSNSEHYTSLPAEVIFSWVLALCISPTKPIPTPPTMLERKKKKHTLYLESASVKVALQNPLGCSKIKVQHKQSTVSHDKCELQIKHIWIRLKICDVIGTKGTGQNEGQVTITKMV